MYDATLTINVVRTAVGPIASIGIWALVAWREKAAPYRTGTYRFPEVDGTLGMINEFAPTEH